MRKNSLKVSIIMIAIYIAITCFFTTFAVTGSELKSTINGQSNVDTKIVTLTIGPIISALQYVTVGIAVIMIMYLGIKYMMAGAEEKAIVKSHLITYSVGAIIAFGAVAIMQVLKNIGINAFK